MNQLLKSLGDERATGRALNDLAQSPKGQSFRAEGQLQYQEVLDQQAQMEFAAQAQTQAQQVVRSGPVMSR